MAQQDVVADARVGFKEAEQLLARLETERSASRAVLAAVAELEARLNTEQATSQALLTKLRELEETSEAKVRELEDAFEDKGPSCAPSARTTPGSGRGSAASSAPWRSSPDARCGSGCASADQRCSAAPSS